MSVKTFVVDTHALVWFLAGDQRLSQQAHTILRDPVVRLVIPTIVLAEVKYLSGKGRLAHTIDKVLDGIHTDPRFLIYPIDLDVIRQMPLSLDIHDSLIVGTALVQKVDGVLTRDEMIRSSGLVPVVW
jgi:PIN domain nuclease of toxin-antitoxin system